MTTEQQINDQPEGKTACIVITDLTDGTTALTAVFDGGFDKASPAHCAVRKLLEQMDNMGMAIIDPDTVQTDTQPGAPAPMLVDGNGHTIIKA